MRTTTYYGPPQHENADSGEREQDVLLRETDESPTTTARVQ